MHTGIDLGLKTTAIVSLDDNGKVLYYAQFGTAFNGVLKNLTRSHDIERYAAYYDKVYKYFEDYHITGTIVMERPSGAALGNGRKALILFGVYLICLSNLFSYYKVFLPQPTAIKRAHTGSGRADKKQMIIHTQKKGFNPKSDHLADAFAMAFMSFEGKL